MSNIIHQLPSSWSALSWRQLCDVWQCKMRYSDNGDVARVAALLALSETLPPAPPCMEGSGHQQPLEGFTVERGDIDPVTGEQRYVVYTPLHAGKGYGSARQREWGRGWVLTPRELSQLAQQTMMWFDFPYGDPGKEAVRDENGKVVEEAVEPVRGYVNTEWRDAMQLPEETLVVCGERILTGSEWQGMTEKPAGALHFKLPEVTMRNITWQQYRTLQFIAPLLFEEGMSEDDVLTLHAQFLAHILVPATAPDARTDGHSSALDPFAPKHDFTYDTNRAEQTVAFWLDRLKIENGTLKINGHGKGRRDSTEAQAQSSMFRSARRDACYRKGRKNGQWSILFPILFQVYQTAMRYYEQVFPLLFNGGGKSDPLQDALTGETKTLNAVMKYQGYIKPEDVYAEDLPVIFSTLNTMAEEAKQIEQMNARINRHR